MCPTILVIHFRFYVIFDAISNICSIVCQRISKWSLRAGDDSFLIINLNLFYEKRKICRWAPIRAKEP